MPQIHLDAIAKRQNTLQNFLFWDTPNNKYTEYDRNDLSISQNPIFGEIGNNTNCTLGFYHQTSNKKNAVEYLANSVRRLYPDSYYMLVSDRGIDFHDLCMKYNIELLHTSSHLGYPVGNYGYRKNSVLEMLKRIYVACIKTNTTHLMYLEDDVLLLDRISNLREDWQIASYNPICNIDPKFIQILTDYSGVKPNVNGYGSAGGTIFNVRTFIDRYFEVVHWIENNFDFIQNNIYPTIGWIDCIFTWVYLLTGNKYTVNRHYHMMWPYDDGKTPDYNFQHNHPVKPEVLHGFKKYY